MAVGVVGVVGIVAAAVASFVSGVGADGVVAVVAAADGARVRDTMPSISADISTLWEPICTATKLLN